MLNMIDKDYWFSKIIDNELWFAFLRIKQSFNVKWAKKIWRGFVKK